MSICVSQFLPMNVLRASYKREKLCMIDKLLNNLEICMSINGVEPMIVWKARHALECQKSKRVNRPGETM